MGRSLLLALLASLVLTPQLFASESEQPPALEIPPGALAPDEGYLLAVFNFRTPVDGIELDRIGGIFGGELIEDIPSGRSLRLLKLRAGEYEYHRIRAAYFRNSGRVIWYDLGEDYRFVVEAGKINYPGDLAYTSLNLFGTSARIQLLNRVSLTLLSLEQGAPELLNGHELSYQGPARDHFAEFARGLPGDPVEGGDSEPAGYAAWVEDWFRIHENREFRLQPAGEYIAWAARVDGRDQLIVRNNATADEYQVSKRLAHGSNPVQDLQWVDDDTLMYAQSSGGRGYSWAILHLTFEDGEASLRHHFRLRHSGFIADPQIDRDDQLLFAYAGDREGRKLGLYRLDIANNVNLPSQFVVKKRLTGSIKQGYHWVVDRSGVPRIVLSAREEGKTSYYHLDPGVRRWRKILVLDDEESFYPVAFDESGENLIVIASHRSDRRGLHRFNIESRSITDTLFEHPSVDISGAIVRSSDRAVIGVRYLSEGHFVSEYISQPDSGEHDLAEHLGAEGTPHVLERSRSGRHQLVFVTRFSDPGAYYLIDREQGTPVHVADADPRFNAMPGGRRQVIKVTSHDGFDLEGYLTLPADAGGGVDGNDATGVPVLVVPHGGPIGVQDHGHFDPAAQFLASIGVAVLKVNYRGSRGFGRSFLEAGKRQWGEGIEDDIDAVLAQAIESQPLDGDRVCIGGISYGGYSALISLVRAPERYRCAASYAGVTDLPLLFNNANWSRSSALIDFLTDIVGDPEQEQERLRRLSPVYRAEDITGPVLLAHGLDDGQVEPEHTLRMDYVLRRLGRDPRLLLFRGEGHGFDSLWSKSVYYSHLARFLAEHLNFELPPESNPPPEQADEADATEGENPDGNEAGGNQRGNSCAGSVTLGDVTMSCEDDESENDDG